MHTNTQLAASSRPQPPLSVDQFAKAFGICRRTVYLLISQRKLRSYKIAGLRRIPPSELEDFPNRQLEEAEL